MIKIERMVDWLKGLGVEGASVVRKDWKKYGGEITSSEWFVNAEGDMELTINLYPFTEEGRVQVVTDLNGQMIKEDIPLEWDGVQLIAGQTK